MDNSFEFAFAKGEMKEKLRLVGASLETKSTYYKVALLLIYFAELSAQNPHMDDDTSDMTLEKNLANRTVERLDELMAELEEMGGKDALIDVLGSEVIE